jgi:hypothetical protein
MPDLINSLLIKMITGFAVVGLFSAAVAQNLNEDKIQFIDRHALVTRHNPEIISINPKSPFTIGNGEFAFTADVTGLQTFPEYYYQNGTPIETLSDWCWHSFPDTNGYTLKNVSKEYLYNGKKVSFPTVQNTPASEWLRSNPHRLPLGRIGFEIKNNNGSVISIDEITKIYQTLDLWTGTLKSLFIVEGEKTVVKTICHPELDLVAIDVSSRLIGTGQIQIVMEFPYAHDPDVKNKPALDWSKPNNHTTNIIFQSKQQVILKRNIDSTEYYINMEWNGTGNVIEREKHKFAFVPLKKAIILF